MLISKINKKIYLQSFLISILIIIILDIIFFIYQLKSNNSIEIISKFKNLFINSNLSLDEQNKNENTNNNNENKSILEEFDQIYQEQKMGNNNKELHEEKIEITNNYKLDEIYKWQLEIPKFNIKANIDEGTSPDVLDQYIRHFEESPNNEGNICLASHNRGYNASYFGNIKDLEMNDEIIYYINEKKVVYKVISKEIIKDTDWSKLENTQEDCLTLITCVEDVPNYRRCVKAIRV